MHVHVLRRMPTQRKPNARPVDYYNSPAVNHNGTSAQPHTSLTKLMMEGSRRQTARACNSFKSKSKPLRKNLIQPQQGGRRRPPAQRCPSPAARRLQR